MNSWYDILKLSKESDVDGLQMVERGEQEKLWHNLTKRYSQTQLEEASDFLLRLVEEEAEMLGGYTTSRVMVGGLS